MSKPDHEHGVDRLSAFKSLFPSTNWGLSVLGLLTSLAALHLAGGLGLKLGSYYLPEIPRWWIGIAVVATFLLVPQSAAQFKPRRCLIGALALGFTLWPLSVWRDRQAHEHTQVTTQVFSLESDGARFGRSVDLESVGFRERRHLNRIAGRRHNVHLRVDALIGIPGTGKHKFQLSCNDRCSLEIDEVGILEAKGAAEENVFLEEGLHSISILYWQGAGTAFMDLVGTVRLLSSFFLSSLLSPNTPTEYRRKLSVQEKTQFFTSVLLRSRGGSWHLEFWSEAASLDKSGKRQAPRTWRERVGHISE